MHALILVIATVTVLATSHYSQWAVVQRIASQDSDDALARRMLRVRGTEGFPLMLPEPISKTTLGCWIHLLALNENQALLAHDFHGVYWEECTAILEGSLEETVAASKQAAGLGELRAQERRVTYLLMLQQRETLLQSLKDANARYVADLVLLLDENQLPGLPVMHADNTRRLSNLFDSALPLGGPI